MSIILMTDYYDQLGLSDDCSESDINTAYRKLALQWHPDRNSDPAAVDKFNKIAEAYDILSNPKRRLKYDNSRADKGSGKGATVLRFTSNNANEVFEKIFGNTNIDEILKKVSKGKGASADNVPKNTRPPAKTATTAHQASAQTRNCLSNDDTVIEAGKPINCTLEDLYTGKRRIVKLEGHTKMVVVEIPPGCHDGHQLPVKNPENGELTYFTIRLQKHPVYWRIKDNLHMSYNLDLKDYINGFTLVVKLLDGKQKRISHKYGGKRVGPELVMKIPKLGMPVHGHSQEYGDLYVHFKILLPQQL